MGTVISGTPLRPKEVALLDFEAAPVEPESREAEQDPQPRKRRKRRSPPKSAAHEARISEYRRRVEDRGWIFAPPTPELPISSLFEHLTVKQIVGLGTNRRLGA
jgi:hypothetical protein